MTDTQLGSTLNIIRIKQISFSVNESLVSTDKGGVLYSMNGRTGYNLERKIFNFTLRAWFHYADIKEELAVIEVENIFAIPDMDKLMQNNRLVLPPMLLISMVSLSLSHTRALFAQGLAGTVYQNSLISVRDPIEVTTNFFPEFGQKLNEFAAKFAKKQKEEIKEKTKTNKESKK